MELQPKSDILLSINTEPVIGSAEVSVRLEKRISKEGTEVEEVIVDCTESAVLQGSRGRLERRVQINRNGNGTQMLSPTEVLAVQLADRQRPESTKQYWVRVEVERMRTLGGPNDTRKEWQRVW